MVLDYLIKLKSRFILIFSEYYIGWQEFLNRLFIQYIGCSHFTHKSEIDTHCGYSVFNHFQNRIIVVYHHANLTANFPTQRISFFDDFYQVAGIDADIACIFFNTSTVVFINFSFEMIIATKSLKIIPSTLRVTYLRRKHK